MYVVGDFNVRFQGTHSTDMGVLGPYTYGKGRQAIDHTASSNRSLCVHMLKQQNMVEVASYKTPNPVHQITYRDKTAPPSEWSQFILDPPVILQFWSHLQKNYGAHTIDIAAHIRSFLPLEQALPPTKKDPTPRPETFSETRPHLHEVAVALICKLVSLEVAYGVSYRPLLGIHGGSGQAGHKDPCPKIKTTIEPQPSKHTTESSFQLSPSGTVGN